jgi:hypothetical protein
MPTIYNVIDDPNTHVLRPVTMQLVDSLLKDNGLNALFGDNIHYLEDTSLTRNTRTDHNTVNITDDRVNVIMNSSINPKDKKWEHSNFKNSIYTGLSKQYTKTDFPIFYDKRADISLNYQTNLSPISLTIELLFKDTVMAYRALDILLNSYGSEPYMIQNSVLYSLPLPNHILLVLSRLYHLRKFTQEISFLDYLKYGSNGDITYAKRNITNDTEIVILKNDFAVISEVNVVTSKPEAQNVERFVDRQMITIEYAYQIIRPNSLTITYPLVIDNQLIPDNILPSKPKEYPNKIEYLYDNKAIEQYHYYDLNDPRYPNKIHRTDKYDDWLPECYLTDKEYKPILIAPILLDTADDGTVLESTTFNLRDIRIKQSTIHPFVFDAFMLQGKGSLYREGLFNIDIYSNDTRLDPSIIEFDTDLNITINTDVAYRRYHLVISECIKFDVLHPKMIPLLLMCHKFFGITICMNINRLLKMGYISISNSVRYNNDYTYSIYGLKEKLSIGNSGYIDGIKYSDLDELHKDDEIIDINNPDKTIAYPLYYNYINKHLTKNDIPIVFGKGGTNGISCPWRIGRFCIKSRQK